MTINRKDVAGKSRLGRTAIYVGALVLIGVLGAAGRGLYGRATAQPTTEAGNPSDVTRAPVVVAPAAMRRFDRSVLVQGNVEAKNWAMVSPRVGGTIEAVFVEKGDMVVAGQTKLFAIDQANLEKAVQIAEHALDVARSSTKEKEASLERVEVDLHKASLDYERFTRLREKEAVTIDAFEQQQSRHQQLLAATKHARTLVELSKSQERQAEASLEIARKNLADAVVVAPIGGAVSERLHEPGEMANPGNPILRIDDPSVVEVVAFLPVQYYPEVAVGRTAMNVRVGTIEIKDLVVSYRSPTVDPKLRTFEVKCLVKNPPAGIVPGAMANITIVFESRQGLGVPSSSIIERSGKPVVFVVRNGAATQVAITPGIEAEGWTEIGQTEVNENEPVVTLGQNMLDNGTTVEVQQEEN
ncbi:MAG TPA: efflux RND transporter periplasmic adaptor subunit [Sedimentisphaerales bacterium]|nr:efflux RND transporter periplasmic adaptor subunit [Sedimentisphaerales bacterium]